MARRARERARARRSRTGPLPARAARRQGAARRGVPALQPQHGLPQHDPARTSRSAPRATTSSSTGCARSCAGTRSRWCCAPESATWTSAVTSPASPPPPPFTTSGSTTSGARPTKDFGGDLVYFQGHSAPGIYARAFVEGRLAEDQLDLFRQEVDGKGVSSYPHPWLMPDFWQFPTVSMGLGPLQAIYQARFLRYLHGRGLANTEGRKVWAFMGDGEMDEPESRGAISLPPREGLDNLIFVINCNLQRLDGPVRGNGKIIQELEARVQRRRLERHQGHLGRLLGSADRPGQDRDPAQADGGRRRRRVPEVQEPRRRLRARALLRQVPRAARDGGEDVRRGHLAPQPRRPRPAQGLRRVRRGQQARGAADGHPREDGQGLRHGRGGRGEEHRPPAEEDADRGAAPVPRPVRDPHP